jgi:hypothetical protein
MTTGDDRAVTTAAPTAAIACPIAAKLTNDNPRAAVAKCPSGSLYSIGLL